MGLSILRMADGLVTLVDEVNQRHIADFLSIASLGGGGGGDLHG